ncbi:MAG: MarR family transcriptional regulator, lower aerobic nicotinate degradation pathway regulator [Gaiellaceae bacterium]|nr:MarR family transcriptional regulator, lower aerobic nicotinate degradation pathway regulator [Gaiellaceae bacterium]
MVGRANWAARLPEMPLTDDAAPATLLEKPGWLIGQISVHHHRLLVDALAAAGARGYHFRLLAALQEFGPASQVTLGRRARLDRSDVVEALDELVDRGYVERAADPDDRRRNIIAITTAGRAHFRRLDRILAGVQDELLSPLSPAQRGQLTRLLRRVLEHHTDHTR